MSVINCVYCGAGPLAVTAPNSFHPVAKDFGPFDLAKCPNCRSWNTLNPPSPAVLAEFYANYEAARPAHYVWAEESGALALQYTDYMRKVLAFAPRSDRFSWADIGAGKGEVANNLHAVRPHSEGTALDIAPRPEKLDPAIKHLSLDLNASDWAAPYAASFDLAYSVAVWEHVLRPFDFLVSCLSLVKPGGALVMICPNGNSTMGALMGTSWPYYEPGEHLYMPSAKGALVCVHKAAAALGLDKSDYQAESRAIPVAYSLRYALVTAGLGSLKNLVPKNASLPLPTGILMTTVRRRA